MERKGKKKGGPKGKVCGKTEEKRGSKDIPSMRLGQLRLLARLLNREPSRSIAPLQILEAVNRNARGARGELQQA